MRIRRHPLIPLRPLFKAAINPERSSASATLFGKGQERYFPSGRIALWHVLNELHITPRDRVLLPAYHCGTEVSVIAQFTTHLSYFRTTEELAIDVDDLASKIDASTKAVVVIHYFGLPSEGLSAVRALCRQRGIALVEDCAHVLPNPHDNEPLGCLGDYSVFSLWKILPVPNGGLRKHNTASSTNPMPAHSRTDLPTAILALKSVCKRTRYDYVPPAAASIAQTPVDRFLAVGDVSAKISTLSLRMAHQLDQAHIFQARREHFLYLLKSLKFTNLIRPTVTSLRPNVCPLYFPLVVERGLRSLLHDRLLEHGIETVPWWDYTHPAFPVERFHEARFLKQTILALPIHHDLNLRDLNRMADQIDRVVRSW